MAGLEGLQKQFNLQILESCVNLYFLYSPLNYMTFEHQNVTGKLYEITTLPDFVHFAWVVNFKLCESLVGLYFVSNCYVPQL